MSYLTVGDLKAVLSGLGPTRAHDPVLSAQDPEGNCIARICDVVYWPKSDHLYPFRACLVLIRDRTSHRSYLQVQQLLNLLQSFPDDLVFLSTLLDWYPRDYCARGVVTDAYTLAGDVEYTAVEEKAEDMGVDEETWSHRIPCVHIFM